MAAKKERGLLKETFVYDSTDLFARFIRFQRSFLLCCMKYPDSLSLLTILFVNSFPASHCLLAQLAAKKRPNLDQNFKPSVEKKNPLGVLMPSTILPPCNVPVYQPPVSILPSDGLYLPLQEPFHAAASYEESFPSFFFCCYKKIVSCREPDVTRIARLFSHIHSCSFNELYESALILPPDPRKAPNQIDWEQLETEQIM